MADRPRLVVLGEKPQAVTWLQAIIDSGKFDIVGGVTRKNHSSCWWGQDNFADVLLENNIPILERKDLYDVNYDIIWSLLYGFIIEKPLLENAKLCLNVHEAPMPKFRGCNGYSFAILEQESRYGTTLHLMDDELDHGEIIDQISFPILPHETSRELYLRTAEVSLELVKRNLDSIASGDFVTRTNPCDDEPVNARNSLQSLKRMNLNEENSFETTLAKVKAMDFLPFEPAYFEFEEQRVYCFIDGSGDREALIESSQVPKSKNVSNNKIINTDLLEQVLEEGYMALNTADRPMILMQENQYRERFALQSKA